MAGYTPQLHQRQQQTHSLLYSSQCPNCTRFIDALSRTPAMAQVSLVDVATLSPQQLARVNAVPALIQPDGSTLYGTQAFEWLRQFEQDIPLDGFDMAPGALQFSDVSAAQSYAMCTESFSAFEPVD